MNISERGSFLFWRTILRPPFACEWAEQGPCLLYIAEISLSSLRVKISTTYTLIQRIFIYTKNRNITNRIEEVILGLL